MNVSEIFKLLGEENRLRMLVLLIDRELCMTHLNEGLELSQANASKHINVLLNNDLVCRRKHKQRHYYKVSPIFIEQYPEIHQFLKQLKNQEAYLEDQARLLAVKHCGCGEDCQCQL